MTDFVRRNGQLEIDEAVVLQFAESEIARALVWANVAKRDHDDVKSLVLEAVWRWWIPEASKNLEKKKWKGDHLKAKLRTALRHYCQSKQIDVIRRRDAQERMIHELGDRDPISALDPGWEYSSREIQFLSYVLSRVKRLAKKAGRDRTRLIMRMMVLIRRATRGEDGYVGGLKAGRSRWTWERLFREIAMLWPEEIEC